MDSTSARHCGRAGEPVGEECRFIENSRRFFAAGKSSTVNRTAAAPIWIGADGIPAESALYIDSRRLNAGITPDWTATTAIRDRQPDPAAILEVSPPVQEFLQIRGARVHNLKNVSVAIPHNQFTVITGVSGSGKSSLAFDTIYAEGQRRYVESLSAYARQFLERMEKPDVDEIDGIAPAIAIRQKNTTRNPRSTVATTTECYDFLRLLFARAGRTYCPQCGKQVQRDTVDHVAARCWRQSRDRAGMRCFPSRRTAARMRCATSCSICGRRDSRGCFRQGRTFEFSTPESLLEIDFAKPLFVLADRIAIGSGPAAALVDTVEICYREAGEIVFENAGDRRAAALQREIRLQALRHCASKSPSRGCSASTARSAPARAARVSATPSITISIWWSRIRRSRSTSGAIKPWRKLRVPPVAGAAAGRPGAVRFDVPYCDLTQAEQDYVWRGDERFPGLRGFFAELEKKKYKLHVRVKLSRYRGYADCPDCRGARLRRGSAVRAGRR